MYFITLVLTQLYLISLYITYLLIQIRTNYDFSGFLYQLVVSLNALVVDPGSVFSI